MNSREKKLFGLLVIVIILAGINFLWSYTIGPALRVQAHSDAQLELKSAQASIAKARVALSDPRTGVAMLARLNDSHIGVLRDPFTTSQDIYGATVADLLTFNGFIEFGGSAMAVIGDREYGVGDLIEGTDDQVTGISPKEVRVRNTKTSKERALPYSGE